MRKVVFLSDVYRLGDFLHKSTCGCNKLQKGEAFAQSTTGQDDDRLADVQFQNLRKDKKVAYINKILANHFESTLKIIKRATKAPTVATKSWEKLVHSTLNTCLKNCFHWPKKKGRNTASHDQYGGYGAYDLWGGHELRRGLELVASSGQTVPSSCRGKELTADKVGDVKK